MVLYAERHNKFNNKQIYTNLTVIILVEYAALLPRSRVANVWIVVAM